MNSLTVNGPRHQRPTSFPEFLFGAPYYPEHWTREDMIDDTRRMAAAGVNVVRMGEFAWDVMEPNPGEFHFGLFDETIGRLAEEGIRTILCTPTATPPRWLTAAHEDFLRCDGEGRRMVHGSRQHCCTNHPAFRSESDRITRAMARHFAGSPHVIGWQTDNEIHCHISECHCPACIGAFRSWLEKKYGTIELLNKAWGSAFWAQTYNRFDQILPPLPGRPTLPNPSQVLDYHRFISDSACDFQRGQVEILRSIQPRWWITHNGLFGHLDYWKFSEDLDFLSVDIYPGFKTNHPADFSWASVKLEECRAAGGNFLVPEQQGGAAGYFGDCFPTPQPGQMRLWAWQSIAHGADGILHFRWRTCRFGAEMYWNGILDHDNIPRRRYKEFAQEGAELRRMGGKILGTTVLARAGILVSSAQEEAHRSYSLGLNGPKAQTALAYHELLTRHIPAGLVDAADDWQRLDLLIIPSFPLMDAELADKLLAYVRSGGVLVATARTATRNLNNHVIAQSPPGLLAELLGMTVEEYGKIGGISIAGEQGRTVSVGQIYEILRPQSAQILGTWSVPPDGPPLAASGTPALTINQVGAGHAIYIGTLFTEENTSQLLDVIFSHCDIPPLADADPFVEIVCRHAAGRHLLFLLNHYGHDKIVRRVPPGIELLSGLRHPGEIELPPYGVAVIECESK